MSLVRVASDNKIHSRTTRVNAKTDAGYERFFFYTDMIQSLRPYEYGENFREWVELLGQIKARHPTRTLFASLRHVSVHNSYISEAGSGNYGWLMGINAAQITDIAILDINETMVAQLISLVARFTNLESLVIMPTLQWKRNGEPLIKALPKLKKLVLHPHSNHLPGILASIPACPQLDALDIWLTHITWKISSEIETPQSTSLAHRSSEERMLNLKLTNSTLELVPELLSHLTPRHIRYTTLELLLPSSMTGPHLSVTGVVDPTSGIFRTAIESISVECPLLTSLTIISEAPFASRLPSRKACGADTLKSLSTLGRLRKINLRMNFLQVVTQSLLDSFAESLPNLEYCYLSPLVNGMEEDYSRVYSLDGTAGIPSSGWVSIDNVAKFTSKLPHLRILGLTLGNLSVGSPEEHLPSSTTLKVLDIGSTDAEKEREFRSYISVAFPYLDSLFLEPWYVPPPIKPDIQLSMPREQSPIWF